MSIVPIGGPGGPSLPRGKPGSVGDFRMPSEATSAARQAPACAAVVDLSAMLSLQDVQAPQERDRRARRQGEGLLAALAKLQRAMLGEAGLDTALANLASLSAHPELAANPALRAASEAIRQRAAVELARAERGRDLGPRS